jgi:hypothetical protein
VVAGATPAAGGGPESQALEVKPVSHRVSLSDLIVFVGAVVLVLVGWGLKRYHDNRTTTVEVDGVSLVYPAGWLRLPTEPPALFRATADDGTGSTLALYAADTAAGDPTQALLFGSPNPAESAPAYTPLDNEPTEVDGNVETTEIQSDYAYVQSEVARSTAPTVVRGRQVAWVQDGRLYVLALEAPEEHWAQAGDRFGRLVDGVGV